MIKDVKNGVFSKYHDFIVKKSHINLRGYMDKELDPRAIKNLGGDSIYITFDLCPSDGYNEDVVNWLIENKIEATFMLSYKWWLMNKGKDLSFLKNPLFSIQGHGYEHLPCNELSEEEQRDEIDGSIEFIKREFGKEITYYRFPLGSITDYSIKYLNSKGIRYLAWTGVILDKFKPYEERDHRRNMALTELKTNIKDGDILILHANKSGYKTFDTLKIIKELTKKFTKI